MANKNEKANGIMNQIIAWLGWAIIALQEAIKTLN